MLTCKQVSKALAEQDYRELPYLKRLGLRLHVSLCFVCRGYNGSVMRFQDMARAFRRHEDKSTPKQQAPEESKKRWQNSISDAL